MKPIIQKSFSHFVVSVWVVSGCLLTSSALAQTYTLKEINPTSSTFDATDPNSSSGGRVNGLGISSDGNTIYAASEWGGIWKSTDRGLTWSHKYQHRPQYTWDVEVNPSNNSQVFATSLYDGRITNSRSGLNVSANGGSSWSKPATFVPPVGLCSATRAEELHGFGIAIDPENNNHIFVGTSCGLAISTDGGANWEFVDPTPADAADDIWDVVVHHGGIIDIVGDDGHQRSIDGGANWTTATSSPLPSGRSSITVSPDEDYVLFASVGRTIFESRNAGDSWPLADTLVNPRRQGRIPFVQTNDRTTGYDLWFGDVRLNRCTCTTPSPAAQGGSRRCPFNSWSADFSKAAGAHNDAGAIIFDPSVIVDACPLAFSNDGGVYRNTLNSSPNCHSPAWEQANETTRALWLFGFGGSEETGSINENLYMGAQDNGSFASGNPGDVVPGWFMQQCCDGFDMVGEVGRVVFTICCFNGANFLFMGNEGLTNVNQITSLPPGNIPGFRFIDIIDIFDDNSYVLVTTSGVFITTDIGANPITWAQIGAASSPINVLGVKASVSNGTPSFIVQSGNCDGRSQDQLFRFNGTGNGNWVQINVPGGTGGFGIFDVDPNNPDRIIASHIRTGSDPEMVITTDGGATWNNLPSLDDMMTRNGTIKYAPVRGAFRITNHTGYVQPSLVAFNPYVSSSIVAGGMDAGLFISSDSGSTWKLLSYPGTFPFPDFSHPFSLRFKKGYRPQVPRPWHVYFEKQLLAKTNFKQNIYIGTMGRGAWRVTVTKPSLFFDLCKIKPWICHPIKIEPPFIICDPLGDLPIVIVDVPEICKRVIDCPGCNTAGLCPYYNFSFRGVAYDDVEVLVYDPKGNSVDVFVLPNEDGKGIALSFKPESEFIREKQIGDYKIAFVFNEKIKTGKLKILTKMMVSDEPFGLKGEAVDVEDVVEIKKAI